MKKVALVFALAVIAPSLVLAWLALRSLRDQEYVVDRQQTLLYESLADSKARAVAQHLAGAQQAFAYQVESLLKAEPARKAATQFDSHLRALWPLAEIGFVVTLEGQVLEPSLFAGSQARKFRLENDRFLCSAETVEVYWNSPKGPINLAKLDQKEAAAQAAQEHPADSKPADTASAAELAAKTGKSARTVVPTKDAGADFGLSKIAAGETNFRELVDDATDGTFARFLQDKLYVMFWHRAADDPHLLFGAQLNLARLVQELRDFVQVGPDLQKEVCVALLNDAGKPVALSHRGFRPLGRKMLPLRVSPPLLPGMNPAPILFNSPLTETGEAVTVEAPSSARADWKRPFVASEVGEALPHWEIAVYLLDPTKVGRSATTLRLTIGLLVAVLVLAIAVGSWLIVADLRRQLTLARQKTDFVSNVSHELKTPLTSIRMFSEMLAEDRVLDESKRRHFLSIITAETARLTRLINNVLDFARLERGEKKYQFEPFDLLELVGDTVESYRPHLEGNGFTLRSELPAQCAEVIGDRDALAQVLVNLLSNAEKYSGERKELEVALTTTPESVEIKVLDRGCGVRPGCEERIFEQFYRADDSLASGIQGSGLGLTLARQIARAHGGDVTYKPRDGGGSCFTLRLPAGKRDVMRPV